MAQAQHRLFGWLDGMGGSPWLIRYPAPLKRPPARTKPSPTEAPSAIPGGLYLEFAKLDSRDSILDFANRFGALGVEAPIPGSAASSPDGEYTDAPDYGERLADWQAAVCDMATAVRLKQALDAKNEAPIKALITLKREGGSAMAYWKDSDPTNDGFERPVSASDGPWPLRVNPNDFATAGRSGMIQLINRGLKGGMTVSLAVRDAPSIEVVQNPTRTLAALWYQLTLAVTGKGLLRACEWCGQTFEILPGGPNQRHGRSDKRFGSDQCRDAAKYQNRKKRSGRTR